MLIRGGLITEWRFVVDYRTENQVAYGIYLRTPHWRRLRDERLEHDGLRCVDCGAVHNLQVHHISYERLGHEFLSDLVTLCGRCHTERHKFKPIELTDWSRIRDEVLEYREGIKYSREELALLAEKYLIEDPRRSNDDPPILLEAHLRERHRKEIYANDGVVDPEIQSGLYWRTHPQGRGWMTPEERRKSDSAGFYAGSVRSMLARREAEGYRWERNLTDLSHETVELLFYQNGDPQVWLLIREALRHLDAAKELAIRGTDIIERTVLCDGKKITVSFSLLDLEAALKRRAKRQHEAVFLNVICDYLQRDVAAIMGITTISIGQYVQSACEKIAEEIATPKVSRTSSAPRGRGSHGYRKDLTSVEGIGTMSADELGRKALEMREAGYTLKAISKSLGWKSDTGCYHAIQKAKRST